jgi:trk system potassium uptake protein
MTIKAKNHELVIIAGCGDVGSNIAIELSKLGKGVVVIDVSEDSFKKLRGNNMVTRVEADATDIDILMQCGAEKAAAFFAFTDDDNTNIMIAEIACRILNIPIVIAGVSDTNNKGALLAGCGIIQINTHHLIQEKMQEKLQEILVMER